MTIAELEINIRDNAKTSSTSLREFANDLREVKSASTEAKGGLEGLANVNPNVNNLRNQVSRLNTALKPLASTLKQIQEGLEALGRRGMKSALRESVQNTSQLQSKVTEATKGTVGTDTSLGDKAAIAIGQSTVATDTAIKEATKDTEELVAKTKEAKMESLDLGKALKGLHITKLLGQFGRLLKMKILRTIVGNLLKGFTEGLENAYNWASITGNAFKASMDKISTSLNYAKNSIGAMVAPLVNMLAPVLDWIVDKFVAVINIINEFFALLGGQATYIRALKAPVQWGEGVSNAMGGAAGAAKDLKDALDVLPFDELNQLSAPSDSGSGGGGGGGSAGGADYGSMFEEVEISKAAGFAGFLRDNFEIIRDLVAGIGAGILAWKFGNTFLSGLSTLQKASLAVSVAGFTLEFAGAYSIGKDGGNWKNILETSVGAALGIGGATLAFGPAGLVIGIAAAIAIGVTGFSLGKDKAYREELSEISENFKLMQQMSIDSQNRVDSLKTTMSSLNSITTDYQAKLSQISVAENLISQIETLASKSSLTQSETNLLKANIDALNSLGLSDIHLEFDELTGSVKGSTEELKANLEELKKYEEEAYKMQLLNETIKAQAQASVQSQLAQAELEQLDANNAELQKWYDEQYMTGNAGWGSLFNHENGLRLTELQEYWSTRKGLVSEIDYEQGIVESLQKTIDLLTGAETANGETTKDITDKSKKYSDAAKNEAYANKQANDAIKNKNTELGNAKIAADNAAKATKGINDELNNVGNGVAYGEIAKRVKNGLAEVGKAGNSVKADIESGINKTGTNLDYAAIKDLINTKLKGQKWAPTGKGIGELIGKALSTGLSISEIYNACYSRLGVVFNDSGWANLGWGVGKAIGGGITNAIAQLINAYTMKVSYTVNGQSRTETIYTEAWWIEHYGGAYAEGGFPQAGSLFIAGEQMGNTEFVGNINGKTAVAPQDDIVTAVQRGVVQALGNGGSETTQVNVYMDSQKLASAVAKGNRMMNRRLNVSVS